MRFLLKNDNEVVDPAVDIHKEDNTYSWIKIWICSIWGKWKLVYTPPPSELSLGENYIILLPIIIVCIPKSLLPICIIPKFTSN